MSRTLLLPLLLLLGCHQTGPVLDMHDALTADLPKAQIDEMLAPVSESPLKLKMDVEDMALDVDEEDITLKIRFGFTQLQLEGPSSTVE